MRRALGKIALLLLVPILALSATVKVTVDKESVAKGDTVTFTITAKGGDVKFPTIKSIGGFPILGSSQSTNISIINGSISKEYSKSFTFAPMQSVTIPSFDVEVDGKVLKTNPIKIEVLQAPKPTAASGGENSLVLKLNKSSAYVGEPIELEITMRYRRDKNFVEAQLQKPQFANFWIKQLGEPKEFNEGSYRVKRYRYLIFPQKAGEYKLGPLTAKFARRVLMKTPLSNDPFFDDDFFNSMFARLEWRSVVSNAPELHVKALPAGVQLYGEFDIRAFVDKREVDANKPLHLTIEVEGFGNIDDVKKFEPDIVDAVVYAEEPKIEAYMDGDRYAGKATQKITIVADRNFTIPSFVLRYFDSKRGEVVEKRTEPIDIVVKGAKPSAKQESLDKGDTDTALKAEQEKESSPPTVRGEDEKRGSFSWLYLIFSFLAGVGITLVWVNFKRFKIKSESGESSIVDRVKRAKNDRQILEILLPYAKKSEFLNKVIRDLEENVFQKGKNKIDKKAIIEELEELDI